MWRYLVAYYWGFRDGWEQPWELVSSANIAYLTDETHDLLTMQEWLDRGANMGQSLRGGRRSQADREGFVPFALRWRLIHAAALLLIGSRCGQIMATEGLNGHVMTLTVACLWFLYVILTGGTAAQQHEKESELP